MCRASFVHLGNDPATVVLSENENALSASFLMDNFNMTYTNAALGLSDNRRFPSFRSPENKHLISHEQLRAHC